MTAQLRQVETMIDYRHHNDLMASVRQLYRRGGIYQKAAEQVQMIIGRATGFGDPFHGVSVTNHGESRIQKCVKYDLPGYSRLITIQDSNIVVLCFVGDHDDCDKWLNRNRGYSLVRDKKGGLTSIQKGSEVGADDTPRGDSGFTEGCLFEKIPEDLFDQLIEGLSRKTVRTLEGFESIVREDAIEALASTIEDPDQARAVCDVFLLLRQDKQQQALDRIAEFTGEVKEISKLSEEELLELADSQNIKKLNANDPRFKQVFEHFAQNAAYMDWMLYLHPDQQKLVDADFNGATKLVGVSGSGKTCVVVQRAIRLALQYPDEQVLILTLNRQLARLIRSMVDAACLPDIRKQILVRPFFRLCQEFLHRFEPHNDKIYDDVTWKSLEHIDEVWREFYRCELNNHSAKVLLPVHDSLIARGVDAEQYIREEFDWIRSAVAPSNREQYLTIERVGRSYPLDKRFRKLLLEGLAHWEDKMRHVGITDYLGLSTALYAHHRKILPQFRCILIDESQDFGTIEYAMIRRLAAENTNDLFFCGDAAQQVSAKHRSFADAGIDLPSARSLKIQKNYRNSREILAAAHDVLSHNLTDDLAKSPEFETLDPEFANFSGSAPMLLQASSLGHEIGYAMQYLQQIIKHDPGKKACLAICGYSLYQLQQYGDALGLKVLDGTITIDEGETYLSDLEHTKGFEFDYVIIANCRDSVLPDKTKPEREQFRDLARFYVAMTRAKTQLVISYTGQMSSYLAHSTHHFLDESWEEYFPNHQVEAVKPPPSLDQIRHSAEAGAHAPKDPLEMTGPEFLYTEYALGLDPMLVEKLRELIPGKRLSINRVPSQWITLRSALEDTRGVPGSRKVFGPEGIQKFWRLIEELDESA